MRTAPALLLVWTAWFEPALPPPAGPIYADAATRLTIKCPAASAMEYPEWYPPSDPAWVARAEEADRENLPARQLVRQARTSDAMGWDKLPDRPLNVFTPLRAIANECGDAALLAHHRGRDADAIELVRDVQHLARLLDAEPNGGAVGNLVAIGIDTLAANRLMVIASALSIGEPGVDRAAIRSMIDDLLAPRERPLLDAEFAADPTANERIPEVLRRVRGERALAAMSLALHLYRHERGAWPARTADLVPDYLPALPADPWAEDKPLGYAVIAGGKPDGNDRVLVYSRAESRDGLQYRTDAPQYDFYQSDGSTRYASQQTRAGQFRDVTRWTPTTRPADDTPQLAPLPAEAIR